MYCYYTSSSILKFNYYNYAIAPLIKQYYIIFNTLNFTTQIINLIR